MDRSTVITLIKETYKVDGLRQRIPCEERRDVYCDARSVSGSEWFEAGRIGMQPSLVFVMFAPDYQGEKVVEYGGERYGIYRTYIGRNERLELYAEKKGALHVTNEG